MSIYNTFLEIIQKDYDFNAKRMHLNRLFQHVLDEAVQEEHLHFTSLFSKIAYLISKYPLPKKLIYALYTLRRRVDQADTTFLEDDIQVFSFVIPELHQIYSQTPIPHSLLPYIPKQLHLNYDVKQPSPYADNLRFICLAIDRENHELLGSLDEDQVINVRVKYQVEDKNKYCSDIISQLEDSELPIHISLIDVVFETESILVPRAFVVDPDFLVDVTAIAGGFDHTGMKTFNYILRKFLPTNWSPALLVGNVANYFLDRLVSNPKLKFQDIVQDIFKLDPLSIARLDDQQTLKLIADLRLHFKHIKQTLQHDFKIHQIDLNSSYLEPSFMSATYGIQGRLDLLSMTNDDSSIVELKSGKVFRPNNYGLKKDHYVQTLLYDLLIRSSFKGSHPKNFILYSQVDKHQLRIAPRIAKQQNDALHLRNKLIQIESKLREADITDKLFESINSKNYSTLTGFEANDVARFERIYKGLDDFEKQYFIHFTNFIAREHRYAKTGEYGQDKSNGLAGLWLDGTTEKCEQFRMLFKLKITQNHSQEIDPILGLEYSSESNVLSDFRVGDIVVLYPYTKGQENALHNQVFKCTVIGLADNKIEIRLRSPQINQELFNTIEYWNIEHDVLDSSFNTMYRQLVEWGAALPEKRQLILGRQAPNCNPSEKNPTDDIPAFKPLSEEQQSLVQAMIDAPDYYLVWGPPGTGKTSRVIRQYIQYIQDETSQPLYVLAYTNRAVDEICACIENLGTEYLDQVIRIGSRFGTAEQYRPLLLNEKIKDCTTRKALLKKIAKHRIVVGTISSIMSKDLVFQLIPPARLVVDEASQILEPAIIGLLARFDQYILVGDHKQLPAVVVQNPKESLVENPLLREVGLIDRRDSLFERLYKRCLDQNWNHALGQLKSQGRMHQDLMVFPNSQFYNNSLQVLPGIERLIEKNTLPRFTFHHVTAPSIERYSKTNSAEVQQVIFILKALYEQGFSSEQIGIITPFRAQIAALKNEIQLFENSYSTIHVDTVERFQGSARDIIIISCCCNSKLQLDQLVSLSSEGIDRKLNVAITRARGFLHVVGDRDVLSMNPIYKSLIEWKS